MEAKVETPETRDNDKKKFVLYDRMISHGDTARVYQGAYDDEPIAIKLFRSDVSFASVAKEVVVLKSLRHENITRYISSGTFRKKYFIAMEFMAEGELLAWFNHRIDELPEASTLPPEALHTARCLAKDMVSGVEFIHEHHIVHCDIKPENVLLTWINGELRAKISDFGGAEKRLEHPHALKGTPNYMPPEHMGLYLQYGEFTRVSYTTKVDIYALGLVLLILLDHTQEVLQLARGEAVRPFFTRALAAVPYTMDANLSEAPVVNRFLSLSPEERPEIASVKEDLFRFWSQDRAAGIIESKNNEENRGVHL